jgi:peptidylprolyl isomerase
VHAEKLLLEVKGGVIEIQLLPEKAPQHVARIKELAAQGFYDGIIFHRVIDGFMAQTGDPTGTGSGGSGQKIKAEFNSENHTRGSVSMARSSNPNSADSQFFIVLKDALFLDGQYTVWGRVVKGMEFVDAIEKGEPPKNPDEIISMRLGG